MKIWRRTMSRVSTNCHSIRVAILFRGWNVPRPELPQLQAASHPREVPVGYLRSIFRPFGIVRRRMDTLERRAWETSRDRRIKVLIVSGLPPSRLYLCTRNQLFASLVNSHLGIIGVSGKAGGTRPLESRHLYRKRGSASYTRFAKVSATWLREAFFQSIFVSMKSTFEIAVSV